MASLLRRNRSICHLFVKNYDASKADALEALKGDKRNINALYRAARACYELHEFEECRKILVEALSIDPSDKDVKRLLTM